MVAVTAPTTARGYIDDGAFWAQILTDFAESVPDLMWPNSVWTYGQMRRDPQLAAMLKGYTLPIRRTPYVVDPAGCRAEVVQLVADDLGLNVAGRDKRGAARTRGVSWTRHLQAALAYLVYGHMGFALHAGIDTEGRARLIGLYERMPQSISNIRVDQTSGLLEGVDQRAQPGTTKLPEIPAQDLLWYCNDREGSNWAGTSLLRPAYAPWLLKREMQRVLATSSRRFGMGVPTIEWAAGSTPTDGQHREAAQVAQQARVGDTAGAALPPGARLVLAGLSGTAPDTLAFIGWLDQQMSRVGLAGWLDLGETSNGSRALGESFVEFFLLSLQAIADDVADTVTTQAVARIVEWNWGPDEPVPAIMAADVGSRREVTAEALKALLDSGALAADPALEEYVRREWRLPAREEPKEPPPAPPVPPQPDPDEEQATDPDAEPAAASQRPRRVAAADSRQPTDVEVASGADFDGIQAEWETARDKLLTGWTKAEKSLRADVLDQIEQAVNAGDLAALGAITVDSADLAELLTAAMLAVAVDAAEGAAREASAQGVDVDVPADLGDAVLAGTAAAVAGVLVGGYVNAAARKALTVTGTGSTPASVRKAVAAHLADMAGSPDGWIADNLGQALTVGQNRGRAALFGAAPPANYYASEINDKARCGPCAKVDGTQFETLAEAEEAYAAGGFRDCEGGLRCRGIIIARFGG